MENSVKLLKTIIVLSTLITGMYFIAKYYVNDKDEKLENEIWSKINDIFNGKDVIWDGWISQVRAKEENVPQYYSEHNENCRGLVTYYEKLSGGFEIIQGKIFPNSTGNDLIYVFTFESLNMGYKGYSYFNPSINACYQSAFDYLTNEYDNNVNANKQRHGFYNRIYNIYSLSNEYYSVREVNKFIPQTFAIENDYWKVFYTTSGHQYSVALNWNAKQKTVCSFQKTL